MTTNEKSTRNRKIWAIALVFLANIIFFLAIWLANKYDRVSMDQIIYQIKTPADGANRSLTSNAFLRIGGPGVVLTVLEILFYLLCTGKFEARFHKIKAYITLRSSRFGKFLVRRAFSFGVASLVFALTFFTVRLNVIGYVSAITSDSMLIENTYVDPHSVKLSFPEQKRNLVYIFLESMEITYSDPEAGGLITDNYIPELTELASENVNFSTNDGVGGALSFTGTTWTAASMVAQTSGVIVQVPLTAENYGGENEYLPGLVSIGEILAEAGYRQTLLLGSDAAFASRDSYFSEHGNYDIVDINTLKERGSLPEDYQVWWGYEDEKLFGFAKEELTRLADSGEPFNFTMLTADSHFPDGYVCELCRDEYEEQYPNVLRCSSRQVTEFIAWIQEQPFYENTTIVISGDHLTMDPEFLEDIEEDYVRTVYNCILNASVEPVKEKNRQFGTFDMFPTTLAAMGVEIEGNRLGLGTNLFSDRPTMAEEYGYEYLDYELQKNSEFYKTHFLEMHEDGFLDELMD